MAPYRLAPRVVDPAAEAREIATFVRQLQSGPPLRREDRILGVIVRSLYVLMLLGLAALAHDAAWWAIPSALVSIWAIGRHFAALRSSSAR
jgi:hypothetical protein